MVRHARVVSLFALLGVGLLSGSCASDRSPPTGITPDFSTQATLSGLLQCTKLAASSVKQTIGTAGGTGNVVAFKPAGLTFLTPAYLVLSYANCSIVASSISKQVAYTTDSLAILYYLATSDNTAAQQVTAQITHFSNYAVAW